MSLKMMLAAMNAKVGNPTTKLVLLKLADNANDEGECWPSYSTIAKVCEIDRRTAVRHVQTLIDKGMVKREKQYTGKSKTNNRYKLTLEHQQPSDKTPPPLEAEDHYPSDHVTPGVGAEDHPPSDRVTLGVGAQCHPNLSLEPTNEPVRLICANAHAQNAHFDQQAGFDTFWTNYPKKVDKKRAEAAYHKNIKTQKQHDNVMRGLLKQISQRAAAPQGAFIPHWKNPSTWLNGENWNDELIIEQEPRRLSAVDQLMHKLNQ